MTSPALPTLGPSPVSGGSGREGSLIVAAGVATFFIGLGEELEAPEGAGSTVSLTITGATTPANDVTTSGVVTDGVLPPALSGTTASLSIVGLLVTLTGLSGLAQEHVGAQVVLTGCGLPGLAGKPWTLSSVLSASSATFVSTCAFAGSSASITHAGSTSTITNLGDLSAAIGSLVISGAATPANNGTFAVASAPAGYPASATVASASGATDSNNGSIAWSWTATDPHSGAIGWSIQPPASAAIVLGSATGLTTDAANGSLGWSVTYYAVGAYVSPADVIAAALAAGTANASWFTWPVSWSVALFTGWGPALALGNDFASALAARIAAGGSYDPVSAGAFREVFNLAPASQAYDAAVALGGQVGS